MRANVSSPKSSSSRKPFARSSAKISGALSPMASRCRPMRTKGSTGSCAAGESMTTAAPPARVRRKYFRNEASPASRLSRASAQPARATKSARSLARSDIEERAPSITIHFQGDAEMLGQQPPQPLRPFDQHDALGQGIFPAELVDLFGRLQAIEIEMPKGAALSLIDLEQGEGRAGHDQVGIAGCRAQDGAGQRG